MRATGMTRRAATGFLALGGIVGPATAQSAEGFPQRTIRIFVPYTPGGFNDTMARVFGKVLQERWGQPVIVENRPGAGTVIGTEAGAKAAPDGYTLVVLGFPFVVNQYLYRKLPFDTKRDFQPILLAGRTPNLLVVRADSPFKTLADFVSAAKAKKGGLNYASAGKGTSLHLAMEYFRSVSGIDVTHVPYRGSAPMITDLLGGQIDIMFDNMPNVISQVESGKMRALAVTSSRRLPAYPDLPTVAESGYPDFEVSVWFGLAAPIGTSRAIVDKFNAELNRALALPDVQAAFAAQGVEPLGGSPDDFKAYFEAQDARWSAVIKQAGIQAD